MKVMLTFFFSLFLLLACNGSGDSTEVENDLHDSRIQTSQGGESLAVNPFSIDTLASPDTSESEKSTQLQRDTDRVEGSAPDTTGRVEGAGTPPSQKTSGGRPSSDECGTISDELITQGKTIFDGKGNCVNCHKADGKGTILGPDLTDAVWIHISGDYPSIIENIRTGVQLPIDHPTPMPAMGGGTLTQDELCAVASYVWSLSHSN